MGSTKKELQEVIELFDKFYERDSMSLKGCPAKLQEAQERLRASDGDEQLEAAAQEEYTQVSKHMERLLNSLNISNKSRAKWTFCLSKSSGRLMRLIVLSQLNRVSCMI